MNGKATIPQRNALHKFGVNNLDPNLTREDASKLMDRLVSLSNAGKRSEIKKLVEDLNGLNIEEYKTRKEAMERMQPAALVERAVEENKAQNDDYIAALSRARQAVETVFFELDTKDVAPLALSLCQSILKDIRTEKINGGSR